MICHFSETKMNMFVEQLNVFNNGASQELGHGGVGLDFFQTLCKTKFKAIIFNNLVRLPQGISFPT